MYDFGSEMAKTYTEECQCGKKIDTSTQDGLEWSEYETEVYVRCECGGSVRFLVPVN